MPGPRLCPVARTTAGRETENNKLQKETLESCDMAKKAADELNEAIEASVDVKKAADKLMNASRAEAADA